MGLHNDEIGLKQIDFLLQRDIYFANTFWPLEELSEECAFYSDAKKIASYNNHEKGIIGNCFKSIEIVYYIHRIYLMREKKNVLKKMLYIF